MAMTVNTNLASLTATNNLSKASNMLSGSFARISSGLRINSAADDAAGLAMSESLDAVGRSLEAASRNTNDGISVVQVAEGATAEVGDILKRMRELAVQASSETLDSTERSYVQTEVTSLVAEIDRISNVTEFNGVALAAGGSLEVQVGVNNTANDRVTISLGDLRSATLGLNGLDVDDTAAAQGAIDDIDNAIDDVNGFRSAFGAVQNRLTTTLNNLQSYGENITAARSRIVDADFAKESADLSKAQIMQQAGTAILGQANSMAQSALRLIG